MSCCICFDTFNKSTRCPSKCPYCSIQICRTCLQTYLLGDSSDIPKCVNPECGHGYNREFLDGELTSTFRLKTYKAHRENVLSDRERSRFPSTQEDVHAYMAAKKTSETLSKNISELEKSISDLNTQTIKQAQRDIRNYGLKQFSIRLNREIPPQYQIEDATYYAAQKTYADYLKAVKPFQKQIRPLKRQLIPLRPILFTYGQRRVETNVVVPELARQEFIKACPSNDCKGFLSSAWKCGLCDLWSCPSCHDVKGDSRDAEHICDPDKVLTVQMLQKEAKSCPKCGVSICKIEGCDQMWCTSCNTGFNWRTGKIANGPIHNPHYFEWLRSQGVAPTPAQGLRLGNCDFETDRAVTNALLGKPSESDKYLLRAWQLMRERQAQQQFGGTDMEEKYRRLRVRYMANELAEVEWKRTLQRYEKDTNFQLANNQIRDVFVGATRDLIRQVLEAGKDRAAIQTQVEELLGYCNASADAVSKRFARCAHKYVPRVA